ncbi:hypothetical protein CKM354_000942300 [Cercospora kikuchii]|uniref:Uncharacterized protein n=1 Tax=Cercospora kikuchii TaxID=84275 RepID=A0A9P3FG67_9PEZI|nr:uncharacterized protein CKM354_000942300 [Cercospora kikuchii]GIZ46293.1 hypothetical protein CKM354_000942300 [Cercospora kikuchii]
MEQSQGPPYPPKVAGVGGRAMPIPDVPIASVLLVFYVGSAVGNMTILQLNRRKGHKFLLSGLLFGFSMARILTLSLRIGVAYHPTNVSLSIASMIFVNAGILIVYIVDLLFVQRIIRARQPEIGWHPLFRLLFKIIYSLVALALVLVIVFIVLSFYTLDTHLRTICRDIQLAAITWLLVVAALPLVLLVLTWALPKSKNAQTFGAGSMTAKSLILVVSSILCTLGAGFKAGVNWQAPRAINNPAWYHSKACFYVFFFVLEIIILYFFLAVRVDRRFHVPDGSSKRKTFDVAIKEQKQNDENAVDHESDVEKEPETDKEATV